MVTTRPTQIDYPVGKIGKKNRRFCPLDIYTFLYKFSCSALRTAEGSHYGMGELLACYGWIFSKIT